MTTRPKVVQGNWKLIPCQILQSNTTKDGAYEILRGFQGNKGQSNTPLVPIPDTMFSIKMLYPLCSLLMSINSTINFSECQEKKKRKRNKFKRDTNLMTVHKVGKGEED